MAVGLSTIVYGIAERKHIAVNLDTIEDAFHAAMSTVNINLPHDLFLTLYPSPDIRWNYGTPVHGQTGPFFLPLNFMIGWKPTEHTVISAEFGIPIIKEFPVYTFKTQLRIGYLF